MEKNTIDRYITEKSPGGLLPGERAAQEFKNRADKVEADVNPLLAISLRGYEMLKEEQVYVDNAEKSLSAGLFRINPYEDKSFKQSTLRSMHELCCSIKTDSDWIAHIQDRVAQGLPPLESDSNQAPDGVARQNAQQNRQGQGQRRGRRGGGQGRQRGQGMGQGMRRGQGAGAGQRGQGAGRGMRRGQGQPQQQQ